MPAGNTHPDGDPFAEKDAAREDNSLLARLERRAREENPDLSKEYAVQEEVAAENQRLLSLKSVDQAVSISSDSNTRSNSPASEANDADNDQTVDQTMEVEQQGDQSTVQANQEGSDDDSDDSDDTESQAGSVALDDDQDRSKIANLNENEAVIHLDAAGKPIPTESGPNAAVPAKKKRIRKKSPPLPPVKVKVQSTIRLDITIPRVPPKGGFIFNLRELAISEGQATKDESEKEDASDGSDNDGGKAPAAPAPAKSALSASTAALLGVKPNGLPGKSNTRKRPRVQDRDEGYDKADPFVDDSEVHLDLVKYCGIPEKDGFYIWPGELPLKPLNGKKPPTRAKKAATATTLNSAAENPSEAETKAPARKRAKTDATSTSGTPAPSAPGTPRSRAKAKAAATPNSKVEMNVASPSITNDGASPSKGAVATPLSAPLMVKVDELKAMIARESFVPKNKFPQSLKEPLFQLAMDCVHASEYDDNFFNLLENIFPYNKFTMTKLVKREIHPRRMQELTTQMENLIAELKIAIDEAMPPCLATYEAAYAKWQEEYAEWSRNRPAGSAELAPTAANGAKEDEVKVLEPGEPVEPKRKFKFDEPMRKLLYEILIIDNEMVKLHNEKLSLEKSNEKPLTEMGARKKIYTRLTALWPEHWMYSQFLSREQSNMKKKLDR